MSEPKINYCVSCAKCSRLYWTLSSQCEICTKSEMDAQAKRIEDLEGLLANAHDILQDSKTASLVYDYDEVMEKIRKALDVKQ